MKDNIIYGNYIPIVKNRIEKTTGIKSPYQIIMDEYHSKHRKCPDCGGETNCQTLVGYVLDMSHPELYKDENRVTCICGWKGVVDQLE